MRKNPFTTLVVLCALTVALISMAVCLGANRRIATLESRLSELEQTVTLTEQNTAPASVEPAITPTAAPETEPTETIPVETTEPPVVIDPYCALRVVNWSAEGTQLDMDVFALAVLPAESQISDAVLTLTQNGQTQTCQLSMAPGEAEYGYEAMVRNASFQISESGPAELWLSVTFDGETVSIYGASWYFENGSLVMISG